MLSRDGKAQPFRTAGGEAAGVLSPERWLIWRGLVGDRRYNKPKWTTTGNSRQAIHNRLCAGLRCGRISSTSDCSAKEHLHPGGVIDRDMQPATYRIRLAWLSAILVALILSMGARTTLAQKGRPLNEQDVLELLQGGVPSARVTEIVSERGIAFALTSGSEQRVRNAGGGDDLVAALRRLSKRTEEPESPRGGGSLRIQTTPGEAQVYINDEPKGITSPEGEIRFSSLKPGTYTVRVSLLGGGREPNDSRHAGPEVPRNSAGPHRTCNTAPGAADLSCNAPSLGNSRAGYQASRRAVL